MTAPRKPTTWEYIQAIAVDAIFTNLEGLLHCFDCPSGYDEYGVGVLLMLAGLTEDEVSALAQMRLAEELTRG